MKISVNAKKLAVLCVVALGLLAATAVDARGQSLTGTLSGIVTDEKGAVIPDAVVVLRNEASGDERNTRTNSEGVYNFAAVQAATYTVTVEAQGFAKYQQTSLGFGVGDKSKVDVTLTAGGIDAAVTVTAAQDGLGAIDTGEKSATITAKQIENISIVGRSAAELIKILPGMTPISNGLQNRPGFDGSAIGINGNGDGGKQSAVGNFSANGGRADAIDIIADGANVSDPGCNCASPVNPNPDMIQEMKVLQSNFGAENAKGPVVITSVTKAGGSEFHGTGYTYLRNYKLNSNDWNNNRANQARPENKYLFPGGNIGGPVLVPGTGFNKNRDKLFFFFGFEYYKQTLDTGLIQRVVPTEAMRAGNFSDATYMARLNNPNVSAVPYQRGADGQPVLDAAGNRVLMPSIPGAAIDPGGRAFINSLPLPNIDPAGAGNGFNYASVIELDQNMTQAVARVDYSFSDNTKLFARYNRQRELQPFPTGLWWRPEFQVPFQSPIVGNNQSDSLSVSLTNVFSPTVTNEIVFGGTYINFPNNFEDREKVSRAALGYPYNGLFKNNADLMPSLEPWSGGAAGVYTPGGFDPELFAEKYLVSIADNFTKVLNTHTLKVGGFFQWVTNAQPGGTPTQGVVNYGTGNSLTSGNAYADLLMGRIAGYNEGSGPAPLHDAAYRIFDFYVNDSWKTTPRLTLDLGVRFSRLGLWYDRVGPGLAIFDPARFNANDITNLSGVVWNARDASVPLTGAKQKALWAMPRVGFAYDTFGNGRTVLRGGFGTYRYHDAQIDGGVFDIPQGQRNGSLPGTGLLLSQVDSVNAAIGSITSFTALDPNDDKQPITYSYSFTVQQRLPLAMTLETAYVGNRSENLLNNGFQNINVIPFGTIPFDQANDPSLNTSLFRPFRGYGSINVVRHTSYSNYNGWQTLLSRQRGDTGFTFSYTFSKALGLRGNSGPAADNLNPRGNSYGVLGLDRTHVFNAAYYVQLPNIAQNYLGNNAVARGFLDGWQVSGITSLASGGNLQALDSSPNFGLNISGINSIALTGTPDTTVQPLLTCDPRENLGEKQFANLACFSAPRAGVQGTYVFPYLKGPAFFNSDLSLFKNFKFTEAKSLQFRVSAFNFLNHPLDTLTPENLRLNFNADGTPTEQTTRLFGRVTDNKFGRRVIQLGLKFYF